jgi:hypothetical protein
MPTPPDSGSQRRTRRTFNVLYEYRDVFFQIVEHRGRVNEIWRRSGGFDTVDAARAQDNPPSRAAHRRSRAIEG